MQWLETFGSGLKRETDGTVYSALLQIDQCQKGPICLGPFWTHQGVTAIQCQCHQFLSWRPDPDAIAIDALAHVWDFDNHYAFPPFSIIGRCLQKIATDRAKVTLIAPMWPTQPWFARILRMCVGPPLLLPRRQDLLRLLQNPQAAHPILHKLHLMAFPLSGNPSSAQDYQAQLHPLSSGHGGTPPQPSIGRIGQSGCNFVLNGRCFPCNHLCNYWLLSLHNFWQRLEPQCY